MCDEADRRAADDSPMTRTGLQDLNFKVEPVYHRVFKTTAAVNGISMKELFESCFHCWIEHCGDEAIKAMYQPIRSGSDELFVLGG